MKLFSEQWLVTQQKANAFHWRGPNINFVDRIIFRL